LNRGNSYKLDLNNDSVIDFTIKLQNQSGSGCPTGFRATLDPINNAINSTPFNIGVAIGSTLSWSESNAILYSHVWTNTYWSCFEAGPGGLWTGGTHYAGLRLQLGSFYYYGWVRINVAPETNVTVFDYAFNSIPNQSILAWDTGSIATSIHYIKFFYSITISPNSFQHLTRISFSLPQPGKTSVVIYDLTGRAIKILADGMMSEGNHQLEWNANDESGNTVSGGIYILQLQSADFSQTEKLMVMK
jgi:hypothetical protein